MGHSTDDVQSETDTCTLSDRFSESKSEKLSQALSPETSSYVVVTDGQRYSRGDSEALQLYGDDGGELPSLLDGPSLLDEVYRANEECIHADFSGDSMGDLDSPLQDDIDMFDSETRGDLTMQHSTTKHPLGDHLSCLETIWLSKAKQ